MTEDDDQDTAADAAFLDQLLGLVPLTEETGFEGPGEYSRCPVCGQGFMRPSVPSPSVAFEYPGSRRRSPWLRHEQLLKEHLDTHPIEDILRAINLLQREVRAGRLLRAKVQAALE